MILYYRKVGAGVCCSKPRITQLLGEERKPSHNYITVSSWKEAKELLKKKHNTVQVHESADMFKVHI